MRRFLAAAALGLALTVGAGTAIVGCGSGFLPDIDLGGISAPDTPEERARVALASIDATVILANRLHATGAISDGDYVEVSRRVGQAFTVVDGAADSVERGAPLDLDQILGIADLVITAIDAELRRTESGGTFDASRAMPEESVEQLENALVWAKE